MSTYSIPHAAAPDGTSNGTGPHGPDGAAPTFAPVPSDPAGTGPGPHGAESVPPGAVYHTIPEAARELGWPERTLRKRIATENLAVYRPTATRRGILVPDALLQELKRRPAPGGPGPHADRTGPHADGPLPPGTVQVLEAKLEGAQTAARLHAQRRHEEAQRHLAEIDREREEREKVERQLAFLQERLVQAEQEGREMRLLMAQSVQAQQQTAGELQAMREQAALTAAPEPPQRVRWWHLWRR